jgi:SAM-dependent methyltransferase
MRHTNYAHIAANYDRRYADEDYSGIERALMMFVGDRHAVVEVGCGTGHWLDRLRSRNVTGWGADLSAEMLKRARAKIGPARLVQSRAEALPFPTGRFDRVFCINAHHHFTDKQQAFREARRILRPGGAVMTIALDPHTGTDRWWVYDYFDGTLEIDRQRYPSCHQIRGWMREAGFTDTLTREVQHMPEDISALAALQSGIVSPDYTSQLAVLTNDEFSAGLRRIQTDLLRDGTTRLTSDLRVYATYGSIA